MVLLSINYIRQLYISIILVLLLLDSSILCDDDDDLEKIYRLRKRPKREFSSFDQQQQQQHQSLLQSSFGRLCPMQCSCSFDTLYCNDLIETCDECAYWTQIEFSRVTNLNEKSFKNYKFAENKTTNIVYKLADGNGTIDENSFKDFYVPKNSQIQITFHYNPVINFNKNALNGIYFDNNSTLVFNFPYTTQIVFNTQFFQTLTMNDKHAKLIIRVFKSFIVRFTSNNNDNDDYSVERVYQSQSLSRRNDWNIINGQFIIDVKSTHLVKFEENCFFNLKMNNAKFYVDLEFIEKLMFFKNSFNNILLDDQSQLTVYLKQISYFSLRPYAFNGIKLLKASNLRFFIKELSTRLCFRSNIFNNIYLNGQNTQFNVSLVNSKNLVFLRESFSNVVVESETAKVNLNVYRLPSVLFNDYNNVVNDERRNYIFPINYHLRSMDYHYNSLTDSLNSEQYDTDNFYIMQKPTYIYNVSMEKQAFYNFALNKQQQTENFNLNLIIDNINTLHIDDILLTPFENERNVGVDKRLNVNFVLNLKNLALNAKSFDNCNKVKIKFTEQPAHFKLDISPNAIYTRETFRNMKIEGFDRHSKLDDDEHHVDVESSEIKSENKIICDFLNYKNDTTISISKLIEPCSCELFDHILNNVNNYDIINDMNKNKKHLVPCILQNSNSIKLCKTQVDINCYHVKQISSSGQNNYKIQSQLDSNEYKNVFIKFWQYCSNGKINGSSDQTSDSTNDFDDNNFFYTSYIYDTDPLLPPSASSYNHLNGSNKEGSRTNIGKIIGIVVVCFICAIILCMIVLNIIQYKFREDQLDDTEANQNADANNNIQFWPFKRTISVQSLKRTLSANSLRRKKEKENRIGTLKSNTSDGDTLRNPETQECCNSDESDDDTTYYEKARERFIVEDDLDKTTTRDENSNVSSNKKSICSVDDNYEDNYEESDKFDASSDSSIQQKSPNRQDLTAANNEKNPNEKTKLCKETRLNEDLGYYSRD